MYYKINLNIMKYHVCYAKKQYKNKIKISKKKKKTHIKNKTKLKNNIQKTININK